MVANPGVSAGDLKNEIMKDNRGNQYGRVRREFKYVLEGVAADLTGTELVQLAKRKGVRSITPDGAVRASAFRPVHVWPQAIGADRLWSFPVFGKRPAIAVIDTGVDKDRTKDFGGRVVATVNFSSLKPDPSDSNADYSGHGTLVAGIAAGASTSFPGTAPKADIVSLRVTNGEGKAVTSDVIAAADWLYENRKSHNIRVANFSLNSPYASYGFLDPLNAAVRRLWLTGTVVVASAGNDGAGRLLDAPASEPFVITVGATDLAGTVRTGDDTNAPWSSHGYTGEGFAKPELAAPGRYMPGPIARTSQFVHMFPSRVVAPGYMWMSGTSFAAPVVSGAAAQLLAINPSLTPDQVKGALMATARDLPLADPGSVGAGPGRRRGRGLAQEPAQPERGARPLRAEGLAGAGRTVLRHRALGVRRRLGSELALRVVVGRLVVGRVLVRRLLVGCLLVGRFLVGRLLVGRLLVGRVLVGRLVVRRVLVGRLLVRRFQEGVGRPSRRPWSARAGRRPRSASREIDESPSWEACLRSGALRYSRRVETATRLRSWRTG